MSLARATNPFGPSLLDKSTAHPGNVDMSIFEKKQSGSASRAEGTTSSDYLDQTKKDNPDPEQETDSAGIILSGCKFTTPADQLAVEKEFQAECTVKLSGDNPPDVTEVFFAVKMTWTDKDGAQQEEDGAEEFSAKLDPSQKEQTVTVKAELPRPPSFPDPGIKIKYKLVASHTETDSTSESDEVELDLVEAFDWMEIPDKHFVEGGFFPCLDEAGTLVDRLAACLCYAKEHTDRSLVAFGHATGGECEANFDLSQQRGRACVALIANNGAAWQDLAKEQLTLKEIQTALKSLVLAYGWSCDPGEIDGEDGPKTQKAVKSFQKACNQKYGLSLTEDGVAGPLTWKAMHRVLMGGIAKALGLEDSKAESVSGLPNVKLDWKDGQGSYGCGDSFAPTDIPGDSPTSQSNQRVDLLFGEVWDFLDPVSDRSTKLDSSNLLPYDAGISKWDVISADLSEKEKAVSGSPIEIYEKHFEDGSHLPNLNDSSFMECLAGIAKFHKENGKCPFETHPDACAEESTCYDKRLQAAESIIHLDESQWANLVSDSSIGDVQRFMTYFASNGWDCDPDGIDNIDGPKTQTAVRNFQNSCNIAWGMDLKIDGICGPKTWGGVLRTLHEMISPEDSKQSDSSNQELEVENG